MFTSLGRIFETAVHKAGFSTSAQTSAPFFQGETFKWVLGCSRTEGVRYTPAPRRSDRNFR